jgi:hypothetical protein
LREGLIDPSVVHLIPQAAGQTLQMPRICSKFAMN